MLVHSVTLCLAGGPGSKEIMTASRAWVHSFASLRKLHSFSRSSAVPSPRLWTGHPVAFDFAGQDNFRSRNLSRTIAHAAALEDSPDLQKKKGERLSRAERYALVENYVLRHKAAHEGKWPTLSAVLKETGGSRAIVKNILDELTTKSSVAAPPSKLDESSISPLDSSPEAEEDTEGTKVVPEVRNKELSAEGYQSEVSASSKVEDAVSGGLSSRDLVSDGELWRGLRKLSSSQRGDSLLEEGSLLPETSDGFDSDMEDTENASLYGESHGMQEDGTPPLSSDSKYTGPSASSQVEAHGLFIRFLPLTATEVDLRAAFQDCGGIVRAQAMHPRGAGLKFTYGFVDFATPEGLAKALKKDKVSIKGHTVLTEPVSGSKRPDNRPTSARIDSPKKILTSSKPVNGSRSHALTRLRRTDSPSVNEATPRATSLEKNSRTVIVEGMHYPMPITAIESIMSPHGKIVRSELARKEEGGYYAEIEYKTEDMRDSALKHRRPILGGRWFRVSSGEAIVTTVVRITNFGADTHEGVILDRCQRFGRVDEIVVRGDDVIDVFFHSSERRSIRRILDKLCDVTLNSRKWHATLAPRCSSQDVRESEEVLEWVDAQKNRLVDSLVASLKSIQIDVEDLKELVETQRHSPSVNGSSRTSRRRFER